MAEVHSKLLDSNTPRDSITNSDVLSPRPKNPSATSYPSVLSSKFWSIAPRPLKTLFDTFPLVTYPSEPSPASSLQVGSDQVLIPRLYVFSETAPCPKFGASSEDDDFVAFTGKLDLSFNPECLKYQAYLKFRGIEHISTPSNNHASPNGALPFLVAPGLERTSDGQRVLSKDKTIVKSCDRICDWVSRNTNNTKEKTRRDSGPESGVGASTFAPEGGMQDAYMSLIEHRVRRAWLYSLYLTSNFDTLATPLYVNSVSNSSIIRSSVAKSLRYTAESELLSASSSSFPNHNFFSSLFTFHSTVPAYTASPSSSSSDSPNNAPPSFTVPAGVLDVSALLEEAREAFMALDEAIRKSPTGWLSGDSEPGVLDAALFGYVYLLLAPVQITSMLEKSGQQVQSRPRWSDLCLHEMLKGTPKIRSHCQKIGNQYFFS